MLRRNYKKVFYVLAAFLLFTQAHFAQASDRDYVLPVAANEIKIMSYNVENLFDAEHDQGKNDYEFLPKSSPDKKHCFDTGSSGGKNCANLDWTDEKVALKLNQIKDAVATQGVLPDILVLVEVENPNVVQQLAKTLGYKYYQMTNSPDTRGIDCAVLFNENKFTAVKFMEREIKNAMHLTRNLSAMIFKLNASLGGGYFAIFPNHWPSQRSPTPARTIAANALRTFVDDVRNMYRSSEFNYVICGDFNTITSDIPNPINGVLLDPKWDAHLINIRDLAQSVSAPMLKQMPPATYYYGVKDEWNELDRFLVSAELNDHQGLEVDPLSYRINAPSLLTKTTKRGEVVPFRYNHNSTDPQYLGYSDHFAVVVKLHYN